MFNDLRSGILHLAQLVDSVVLKDEETGDLFPARPLVVASLLSKRAMQAEASKLSEDGSSQATSETRIAAESDRACSVIIEGEAFHGPEDMHPHIIRGFGASPWKKRMLSSMDLITWTR